MSPLHYITRATPPLPGFGFVIGFVSGFVTGFWLTVYLLDWLIGLQHILAP